MTRRRFRKLLKGLLWIGAFLGLALLALVVAGSFWIHGYRKARPGHFVEPRASVESVAFERDTEAGSDAVQIQATDGFIVRLRVVRDVSHDHPRRVMIVLGGHRTGRDAARLVGDPGKLAVVAVDYPYDGPDKIRGWRQAWQNAPLIQRALLDTPRALSQALDWTLTQSWADPDQVELVGVSLGVPFTAVAAAVDDRFTRAWLIQGGADNRAWIESNLQRKIARPWLREVAAWLVHTLAHGASLDTSAWVGRISPRPVVIIGALQDERLPPEQVEALFAAAGEPKELVWIEGRHVNPRRPESVQRILDVVRSRL